jgi:hypothetical protein
MLRALALATLFAVVSGAARAQEPGVLHIKVTLTDASQAPVPVARHALLISDNPATGVPRRVVTAADGTVDVRRRPGNYTVESDEPVGFEGKGYEWTTDVDIVAGRDAVLALTLANAEIVAAPAPSAVSPERVDSDPSLLLSKWKESVVAIWTPESRASGFVVDASGLVVTNQRLIGSASAVEVQLTDSVKVAARVLAADRVRDVAVLWVDSTAAALVAPLALDCAAPPRPAFTVEQRLITIGLPLRGPRDMSRGEVIRVDAHATVADFRLDTGSAGGPVFNSEGAIVGLASIADDEDDRRQRDVRIVAVKDACDAIAAAEKARPTTSTPAATHLPVEPLTPFPAAALAALSPGRTGSLSAFQMASSDFDVTFLTPIAVYGAQHIPQDTNARIGRGNMRGRDLQLQLAPPTDFGGWSDYFADAPPVLAIRVTPKLTESFWTTVARGAAYTQGASIPAIKHFKTGFTRMRLFCGDAEVMPIHPFTLEQPVSETDSIREGLYVFDPQAIGPQCKSVRLGLFSEKAPEKQDTRPVDPQLVDRIWQDFGAYRAQPTAASNGHP